MGNERNKSPLLMSLLMFLFNQNQPKKNKQKTVPGSECSEFSPGYCHFLDLMSALEVFQGTNFHKLDIHNKVAPCKDTGIKMFEMLQTFLTEVKVNLHKGQV